MNADYTQPWPRQRRIELQCAQRSDQGGRPSNQDVLATRQMGHWWLCAMADGAGGHAGGELAARLAVDEVLLAWPDCAPPPLGVSGMLEQLVRRANLRVLQHREQDRACADMHTTLTVVAIDCRHAMAWHAHSGDTRVYRFRDEQVMFCTRDHSHASWMAEHGGGGTADGRHALYSALGQSEVSLVVDVSTDPMALEPGDVLLVCTDGLWSNFEHRELAMVQALIAEPQALSTHLHALAVERAGLKADNLSSVVVRVMDGVPE